MTKKKKPADVGTVLHKIKDAEALKPWAGYMAGEEPWKGLELTAEKLFERWSAPGAKWQFFSAADPKTAKAPGFDNEHGLIVFSLEGARAIVEGFLKTALAAELGDGGYVQSFATKVRHKGLGKYLMAAAERVMLEKSSRVFLFVSESNAAAQRFYKGLGYEEVARAQDCHKPGNTEILLTKKLEK